MTSNEVKSQLLLKMVYPEKVRSVSMVVHAIFMIVGAKIVGNLLALEADEEVETERIIIREQDVKRLIHNINDEIVMMYSQTIQDMLKFIDNQDALQKYIQTAIPEIFESIKENRKERIEAIAAMQAARQQTLQAAISPTQPPAPPGGSPAAPPTNKGPGGLPRIGSV